MFLSDAADGRRHQDGNINYLSRRSALINFPAFGLTTFVSSQNLLTSEQSYIILKSITKLPIDLAPTYYPSLLTIIWENPEAEAILGRDFDIQVSCSRFIAPLDLTFHPSTDAQGVRKVGARQEEPASAHAGNLK